MVNTRNSLEKYYCSQSKSREIFKMKSRLFYLVFETSEKSLKAIRKRLHANQFMLFHPLCQGKQHQHSAYKTKN